jgi:hypothetical protein
MNDEPNTWSGYTLDDSTDEKSSTKKSALQELLEDGGLRTRDYSGRYMYGKKCLGVEVDDLGGFISAVFQVAAEADCDFSEIAESFQDMRTDSMGSGVIIYFPKIEFITDDDPEDRDDDLRRPFRDE